MSLQNTDADGNGIIDREEMASLIKKLGIPLKDPVMDIDFIFGEYQKLQSHAFSAWLESVKNRYVGYK